MPGTVSRDGAPEPGWALTGGRRKNVAIAASSVAEEGRSQGERFEPQTPEEAAALAEYNRYLAELNADSSAVQPGDRPAASRPPAAAWTRSVPGVGEGSCDGALTRYRVMAFVVGTGPDHPGVRRHPPAVRGQRTTGGRDRGTHPRLPLHRLPGGRPPTSPDGPTGAWDGS